MLLQNKGISINVLFEGDFSDKSKSPILFLHGFTGSSNDWKFIYPHLTSEFFPIAIDLPGHGKTTAPNDLKYFSTESYVEVINQVANYFDIGKIIIVGYSMGGRAALQFANKYPERIKALILESSTAGIENQKERVSRVRIDSELADSLTENGISKFVDQWMELPFFQSLESLSDEEYSKIVFNKKNNSTTGLSNSLKGFSTGKMPSVWDRLSSFDFPTLLIVGALDRKYVRINKSMSEKFPNSELKIIPDVGHNTHLENKNEFIILVNNFLRNLEQDET